MPPVRAASESKPSRYDRTRLENQERAYVAASRRTDRGLNARMQSARRASEIHQKRTGRALRVTEVEVLNEAFYEEITDVSTQRRRWRAHLHSQSEDFDRTLLACMTSQIAAQNVLDQAVAGTWLEEQRDAAAGFVKPDYIQAMSSPHQVIDMSTCNSQNTPYLTGVWATQSGFRADPSPLVLSNNGSSNQGAMDPLNPPYLEISKRTSVPTDFAPKAFHFPVWISTTSTDCSTSPLLRADPVIDYTHPQNRSQQTVLHQPSPKSMVSNTPPLLPSDLLPGKQLIPLVNLHDLSHGMEGHPFTTSPRHDFTDRRYHYNPNGKPKPTLSSSNSSLSVHHTPSGSLSLSIQTPATFTKT